MDAKRAMEQAQAERTAARQRGSGPTGATQAEIDLERMLLTREQRIGQELKNSKTRRELAPVQVIEWVLGKVSGELCAQFEAIPGRIKLLLPKLTATEIDHIKREIVKAQNTASRITVDLDEYYTEMEPTDSKGSER